MTGICLCVLATMGLIGNGFPTATLTSPATMEELTIMATQQALATWKPVEIPNGSYVVKVTPVSKTLGGGCPLLHHIVRK